MKRFLVGISSAVLSVALLAGAPAFAQTQTADAVLTGMAQLGMHTEDLVLTEDQVLQVQAILNDAAQGDADKVAAINALLGL